MREGLETEVGVRWLLAWELVIWSTEWVVRQSLASRDVSMEAEEARYWKPLPGDNR
jgi:hypothetical protein